MSADEVGVKEEAARMRFVLTLDGMAEPERCNLLAMEHDPELGALAQLARLAGFVGVAATIERHAAARRLGAPSPDTALPSSCVSAATGLQALATMSPEAKAYHDEYWEWLWHGEDSHRLIGDKKAELRAKRGEAAERELLAALRADGFLPQEKPVA